MERYYHVDFKVESNIINAHITLHESITDNEVYAVCYPNLTKVMQFKVDGVPYEIIRNWAKDTTKYVDLTTMKAVRSKRQKEYLKEVVNDIIKKGNEYIKNTFGNVDKPILEID